MFYFSDSPLAIPAAAADHYTPHHSPHPTEIHRTHQPQPQRRHQNIHHLMPTVKHDRLIPHKLPRPSSQRQALPQPALPRAHPHANKPQCPATRIIQMCSIAVKLARCLRHTIITVAIQHVERKPVIAPHALTRAHLDMLDEPGEGAESEAAAVVWTLVAVGCVPAAREVQVERLEGHEAEVVRDAEVALVTV